MSDNNQEGESIFFFPEGEEPDVVSLNSTRDEPVGWRVDEYVGVSICNAWVLVPDHVRLKWQRLNFWTKFVGFEFSPEFTEGAYSGMKVRGVNPFAKLRRWWNIRLAFSKDRRLL